MTSHIAVEFVGDAHHKRQQKQLDQHPQENIVHGEQGKDHRIDENCRNDNDQQEAGAAPGMVLGLGPDVVHRQLQTLLIAEDGLMLRAVIGEGPADVLHPGYGDHIGHEDGDTQYSVHQIPDQDAVREALHEAGQEGRQEHKQADGEANGQHHGEADDGLLHFFVSQLLVQPFLEF